MAEITANIVVSNPSQQFTLARSFKALANGKIYIGKIDTDPANPENQIQVYIESEDGSHVPVSQPIVINAGGYPVYNGQIAKFVTVQGHSMAVYDAYGVQQFYYPNVLKYDPDRLRQELSGSMGFGLIGGATYQQIRDYSGDLLRTYCIGREHVLDGAAGVFCVDEEDTKSEDNDGTILVDTKGRRWKRQLSEPLTPLWFGAKFDGVTDDTDAINSCLSVRSPVRFPAGVTLISSELKFIDQYIEGAGCAPDPTRGTIIAVSGDHPCFQYDDDGGYSLGGGIKGFFINYGEDKTTSDSGLSRGIDFGETEAQAWPSQFRVEDVIVRGAYYGFYDKTGAFQIVYKNCKGNNCWQSFVKYQGTTVEYDNCYADKCYGAWDIKHCHVVSFVNCAYDFTKRFGVIYPIELVGCYGVTINGMQHESGEINVDESAGIKIIGCKGVIINGLSIPFSKVSVTTGEVYLIDATDSLVDINGLRISDVETDMISYGAYVIAVLARSGAIINVRNSYIGAWKGAGGNISFEALDTGMINFDNSVIKRGSVAGNRVFNNGAMSPVGFSLDGVGVPANGTVDLGTLPYPGMISSDFLIWNSTFTPTGCTVTPMRISDGNVSVTISNNTNTARTFTGTINVSAIRY